jgi:hypothetical protein
MKKRMLLITCHLMLLGVLNVQAASVSIGAAPKGNAKKVAERIIKYNFPRCKHVTTAARASDGTIQAKCSGVDYRVFTLYNAEEGKMSELAMNCTASKQLLGVDCYESGK